MSWVLGMDIGGSGSRAALCPVEAVTDQDGSRVLRVDGAGVQIASGGSSVPEVALRLVDEVAARWPDQMAAVRGAALGATGMATLVPDPLSLAERLARRLGDHAPGAPDEKPVAVCIDAVTAHLGALGGAPGGVTALGTGAISLGGDGSTRWRRADGWGHLLGDRGSASWIGLRGLQAAIGAHDGIDSTGDALLRAAEERFGGVPSWPRQLYTRADRADVLGGFAPDVDDLADQGDPAAGAIMSDAGTEAARSVLAALGEGLPSRVCLLGGPARSRALHDSFNRAVRAVRPDAEVIPPSGDPLAGALILAERAHEVSHCEGFVWTSLSADG